MPPHLHAADLDRSAAAAVSAQLGAIGRSFLEAPEWRRRIFLERVLGSVFTDSATLVTVAVEDASTDQLIRELEVQARREQNRRNRWTYDGNRLMALRSYADALRFEAGREEAA